MLTAGTSDLLFFCLVLARMTGFVLFNPILGRGNVPVMFRVGLSLMLSVLVWSVGGQEPSALPFGADETLGFLLLLMKELLCGYALGYVMVLFDFIVTGAGQVIDFEIGLSMSTVYDPQSGVQLAMTGQILQIYYMLLFFAAGGHLAMLRIFLTSGQVLPYAGAVQWTMLADAAITLFTECVVMLVKLALPVMAMEFLVEMAMGMLIRIIPQINLFSLNIEIKVVVGILVLFLLMTPLGGHLEGLIRQMLAEAGGILSSMRG